MCIICVQYEMGKMTMGEVALAHREITAFSEDDEEALAHFNEFTEKLTDEEFFKLGRELMKLREIQEEYS